MQLLDKRDTPNKPPRFSAKTEQNSKKNFVTEKHESPSELTTELHLADAKLEEKIEELVAKNSTHSLLNAATLKSLHNKY